MYAYARPGASAVLDTVAMDLAASDDFSNSMKSNGDRDMVSADAFPLPHSRSKEYPAARLHSAGLQHHPSHAFPIRPSTSGEVRMKGRAESCGVHAPAASGALANSFEVSVKTFRIPGFEISNEGIKQVPVPNQKKSPQHTPPFAAPSVAPAATGPSNWASGSYSGQMLSYNDAILEHKSATDTPSPPSSFTSLIRSPTELIRLSNVGRGACGTVVRALHVPSLKLVAIKQIGVFDKDRRHQLVKELRGLSATADINELISLYGAFFDEGTVSLVLEYMNRHSLQEQLNQHGPMNEFLLQRVCLHAVRGLAQLHARHLIHRDIKPGNMLINSKVEVKLADFGVLAALEHSQDFAKSYVGTVMYMSPERVGGAYGTAADIWSLGQTLITLATGHTPYDTGAGYFGIVRKITQEPPPSLPCSANPEHVASGVRTFSPELCSFVAACLVQDATKRWTAKQLLEHPFLKNADAVWANSHAERVHTISVISRLGHNDVADVQTLLQIVAEKCYFETGDQYKRSLFDLARVAKLAEEFGIDPKDMQELFESSYRQSFARWQAKVQQQQMQPQYPFAQLHSADSQQAAPSFGSVPVLSGTSQLLPAEHPAPPVLPIENQGPVQLKMPLHRRNKAQ